LVDDYDGPVVFVPAHPNNIRPGANNPKVLVLHTPEEKADATEVTPFYFSRNLLLADPPRRASTHYYASGGVATGGDGDLYQMVREDEGAIANGVLNKPYPADTDGTTSLNLQSLSIEIEGYAANIHKSMPVGSRQWITVVRWVESRARKYNIPLDRKHVIGHYEVASNRTDPGTLDIDLIVKHAQALRNQEDGYMFTNYTDDEGFWLVLTTKGKTPVFRRKYPHVPTQNHLIEQYGEPLAVGEGPPAYSKAQFATISVIG